MQIEDVIEKHGPWNAHSVEYAKGQFTFGGANQAQWLQHRGDVYAELMRQSLRKRFENARVLDLGSFEGGLSYHLARNGAEVTGLEIRDAHLAKAEFLRTSFPDLSFNFAKGDMLKLHDYDLGQFDAVLMAGTLYHIDAPDIIPTLRTLADMANVLVVDTHVAHQVMETFYDETAGIMLYGRSIVEHNEGAEDKEAKLRASATNNFSFWPTERSLVNALLAAGFTSVTRPLSPTVEWPFKDRAVWVAVRDSAMPGRQLAEPDARPVEHQMFHNANHRRRKNPSTSQI